MRRIIAICLRSVLVIICLGGVIMTADASTVKGRIYGKITTTDGDILEGCIRWDRNEASWDDILDGQIDRDDRRERRSHSSSRREKRVQIFGMTFYTENGEGWMSQSQSGVAFGHIKSLEPDGDAAVLVTLKSGERLTFKSGSTDFGQDIREVIIEDKKLGETELSWDEIERVDFASAPQVATSVMGDRLYGTLTTRRGDSFTGAVTWDVDEVFSTDILEGRVNDRKRRIKFGKVLSIKRRGPSGALVTTTDGAEMRMEESNDVDESNRGISVSDVSLGRVTVQWDEFEKLVFSPSPDNISYAMYNGGHKLSGVVLTEDGEKISGEIVWDDDERGTWELLDGNYREMEFDIFFQNVASITRDSRTGSTVTLRDGRTWRLRDSNDVDSDNKGIVVTTTSGRQEFDWIDVASVTFNK